MATFTWTPDFGAQLSRAPRVKTAQFGDGYQQRAQFGINNNPQSWSLQFVNREDTEADEIDAFLTARRAVEAFDWTPPRQSTAIKVVCDSWNVEIVKHNLNSISATFRQVFEA